jgi:uncharacterized protein
MTPQASLTGLIDKIPFGPFRVPVNERPLTVHNLTNEDEIEVLAFLAARPLHTVAMASLIRDNGLVSPSNRGAFYACRDQEGDLEGVALIGHATLIETRTDDGMKALASIAQDCQSTHVIFGEQEKLASFWNHYAADDRTPRLLCRELLFEQRWPIATREAVTGLRRATLNELELVAPVQAQMAFDEGGINPMNTDPTGFRARCARRIEQGRTWVYIEEGRLIFKAEVVAETWDVTYLEGIYVRPESRGKGYGLRCLSQLSQTLLAQAKSICILVNEQNKPAEGLYRKAGYKLRGFYETIYMHR